MKKLKSSIGHINRNKVTLSTIWSKQFKNKRIDLNYIYYDSINKEYPFVLIIINRDGYYNQYKRSIKNIFKYLKKNLTANELLEVERIIFTKM